MQTVYTAVIQRNGDWWIGWVEELTGVSSQGRTREELVENLRSALAEALEMNRADRGELSPPRNQGLLSWLLACPEKGFFSPIESEAKGASSSVSREGDCEQVLQAPSGGDSM